MRLLFKNIKELVQVRREKIAFVAGQDMKTLPTIKEAYLLIENDQILDFGLMKDYQAISVDKAIDLTGRLVLPTWCDSHTHLVYAGNREKEFVDRINGLSYEEIAKRGGGILNSAKILQETSEEELFQQSKQRLETVIHSGTGAIEIKSGYGLTLEGELKMLRVIKRLKEIYPIPIKATFLAAHALPLIYKQDKAAFFQLMLEETLPIIAEEKLAEYIDVFCEAGYFNLEDMDMILTAGHRHGLIPKVHVNQFTAFGGVQKAVDHGALSVDHLEVLQESDIVALQNSKTMPIALPGCSFYLGIPYTPARRIIENGLPIGIASDFNPGSAPSGNMNFVVSCACIKMKMTPEEAINAATINAAYAMNLEEELGSITKGKRANLMITQPINSYASIPYSFGENLVDQVYVNGSLWSAKD